MKQNETDFTPKNAVKFECKKCDFVCSKSSDWQRHLLTLKHLNDDATTQKKAQKNGHFCLCGKEYKYRQGLSLHKKTCQNLCEEILPPSSLPSEDKEIIKLLIKDNSELKAIMMEVVKSIQPNNTNNSHNNNNNTTTNNNGNHFNLQIYLNETCKDAVNLTDFVDSLQVKLKDLEDTAKIGYSEGVSKIFINGLNELEVNKRPIHCSDAKRETLYIKNKNEWTKDSDKVQLTSAIKRVGKKNIQQIFEWQKKYPEYNDPESKQNDKYLKMLCNAMNGSTDDEQEKNMDKIVRNITKEVVIDKQLMFRSS
jgi:hypothetical protein